MTKPTQKERRERKTQKQKPNNKTQHEEQEDKCFKSNDIVNAMSAIKH